MPKTTETRAKTRDAFESLLSQGQVPTARKIHKLLGSGSLSTIADELRKLGSEQSAAEDENTAHVSVKKGASSAQGPGEVSDVAFALTEMKHALEAMSNEIADLRTSSAEQLKVAYQRYEAVQRQSMLQIDAARIEAAELRERLRTLSADAQSREDVLRGLAQNLRDENLQLRGQLEECRRRGDKA